MFYSPGNKPFVKRGAIILLLVFAIYLLTLFASYPQAVEHYYSQSIYPLLCRLLHPVFNLVPFSIGDIVYIAVICYVLFKTFVFLRELFKGRFKKVALLSMGAVIGVQLAVFIFYVFWGMNYFRQSAAERLNLRAGAYTLNELTTVTNILIDSANAARARISQKDLQQANDTIYKRALAAVMVLSNSSGNYHTYSPRIKASLLTGLLNYIGTSGYYNPFTTEAQINYQMPVFNRPFVACHELSHQTGFAPEDEANFAGFMAAISSKDKLLRYSAYHAAIGEFMFTLRGADSVVYKQVKTRISPLVKQDFKTERLYWQSYQNKANMITGIFYDSFLKANNQPAGLNTYNKMVVLIMALYKQHGL